MTGLWASENEKTPFIDVTSSGDDKGLIVTEQFSVGTPASPKESVFGAGDSYPVGTELTGPDATPAAGSAWHCTIANTTGQSVVSATDITSTLASDSGSSIGLFGSTSAGNYLLIGSDFRFAGLKAKVATAGSVEPTGVQGEFLPGESEAWLAASFMVSQADWPYEQRANNIATEIGSEQWHFGFNPLVDRNTWEKATLNINGTDYTKYWARFRVVSDIVTDPVIEQLKLHTDRFEINADGSTEYYGLGVYPKTLLAGIGHLIENSGITPSNQSVTYDTGAVTAAYKNNKFTFNKLDTGILVQNIVDGVHTGVPLVLSISYYVNSANTGAIEWETDVYEIADGFVYDGTAVPRNYNVIDTVASPSNQVRRTANILIPIDNLTYDDAILIVIKRDATSGNSDDTLEADCVATNIRLTGYFWRP